ncbi:Uncharacterised protein [Citrobacter youngae]|uniref:Uncharacterized protein n=1 Tax=Citrobacter youngae TaxID=133448 RepID=A0A9Q7ZPZ8_9ENTR|nr:hypothetical protein [Citrobacter youngae]SUX81010.1 Uncharacterised protein [Citrobacter youngae]
MTSFKERLVDKALTFTDGWNHVLHNAFEKRIVDEYKRSFPEGIVNEHERTKMLERMRQFYYTRMMTTATLILAVVSLLVSVLALLIAAFAL